MYQQSDVTKIIGAPDLKHQLKKEYDYEVRRFVLEIISQRNKLLLILFTYDSGMIIP